MKVQYPKTDLISPLQKDSLYLTRCSLADRRFRTVVLPSKATSRHGFQGSTDPVGRLSLIKRA